MDDNPHTLGMNMVNLQSCIIIEIELDARQDVA
jgi:hypothetical protein